MKHEAVCETPQDLEEAARSIAALIPAGHRFNVSVPAMDGAHLRETPTGCDWSRLRAGDDRRSDRGRAHRLVYRVVWSDRWSKAGGPFMQEQAVLRANTSRTSDPQAELQET